MNNDKPTKKAVAIHGDEPSAEELMLDTYQEFSMDAESEADVLHREQNNQFEFPAGLVVDGEVLRSFRVHELTGYEEEKTSNEKIRRNPAVFLTTLLHLCIDEIGGIGKPSVEQIRNLLIGDRDFAMLCLRRVSYGDDMEVTLQCPSCTDTRTETYDLSSVEVKRLEDDEPRKAKITLSRGVQDPQGVSQKEVIFRFPDGRIQEKVLPIMQRNPSLGGTTLLTSCCEKFGNMRHFDTATFRKLSKKERDFIAKVLVQKAPGPEMSVPFTCDCGYEGRVGFDFTDFFPST